MQQGNAITEWLTSLPVRTDTHMPDGVVVMTARWPGSGRVEYLVVGVTENDVHEQAHRIVREGLADVLRWLGQPVLTGRQTIEHMRTDWSTP